jgi:hypothetical protein
MWEHHARDELRALLVEMLAGSQIEPEPEVPGVMSADIQTLRRSLAENSETRANFQRLAGRGLLTEIELAERQAELQAERADLEKHLAAATDQEKRARHRGRRRDGLADLLADWDALWLRPVEANARLGEWIERIVVAGRHISDVVLRD